MNVEHQVRWRILLVEDDESVADQTKATIERRPVNAQGEYASVLVEPDFAKALDRLEERRFDLVILDIRDQQAAIAESMEDATDGDDAIEADKGLELQKEIRRRRFLPIVFHSAVAHLASELQNPPFVTVVDKLDLNENALRDGLAAVFSTPLPAIGRALTTHVDKVLRNFMAEFLEKRWTDLHRPAGTADLAYLIARRLAHSFDSGAIEGIPDHATTAVSDGHVHPTRLYVMPPAVELTTGEIVRNKAGQWFVVCSPACDLVVRNGKPKADYVLLAACDLVDESQEYRDWVVNQGSSQTKRLDKVLTNNRDGQRDRYFFLPRAWDHPDLLVDLQKLSHLPFAELSTYERAATLDDPYAQSLIAQLGRFVGRMGTPDLDVGIVRQRMVSPREAIPPSEGDAITAERSAGSADKRLASVLPVPGGGEALSAESVTQEPNGVWVDGNHPGS